MAQRQHQALNSQAADWLARLQREELSAAERAQFEHWLDTDPAHAVAFARAEYAWERAARLRAAVATAARRQASRFPFRHWAVAAGLALVMLGSVLGYRAWQSNVYSTALGERRAVTLDDGSQVHLNTESRLAVAFDARQRVVHLRQGEALFKVARDSRRPFIVDAGATRVRALGTAFNVRLRDQVVEVTVTEGLVAVDDAKVAAGSAAVVAAGTVNHVELKGDVMQRRVAWRDGVIELKGETLEQAVEEFNRYRKHRLVVADPAIANMRMGGRFETDEAQKFLNALSVNFGVRVVEGKSGEAYLFGPE